MSYTKIETSTKDAKTKKALTLGELANANSTTWKAIDAKTLTGWCETIQAANNTFSGLDEVWEKNREALSKQFKGDTLELEFEREELVRLEDVADGIATRLFALRTEQRAPEPVTE